MTERKQIKKYIDSWDGDIESRSFTEVIAWFNECLAKVPEEYRGTATVELTGHCWQGGDPWGEIDIFYECPETDQEMMQRTDREFIIQKRHDQTERDTYEKLKLKFETPT